MVYRKNDIKKNIGQAILVGKCCHCRINYDLWFSKKVPLSNVAAM
jgi:hypothetical protein